MLDWSCRARYQIKVRGLENFTRSPSSLVVFNHRRDADTPIIGNVLFGRHGLWARDVAPVFVAREDLFRTGFLAHYLKEWPSPARRLLYHLNLRPFLWALRAHPMRRIAERTLREVLEDVLRVFGDLPLHQVLKAEWVERFEQLAPPGERPLRLRQLLEERFEPLLRQGYGLTKLSRRQFRALKPCERAAIESQLQLFVEMLDGGEVLQLAPEGAVSRDGRFARIRAGLHVLLNRPQAHVRVVPVGITYDFMTTSRQWVFVNVGPEMTELRGLRPSEASSRVTKAILAQSTITVSQLASQLVLAVQSRGGGVLLRARLLEHVAAEAHSWAKVGLYLDPRLLTKADLERRVDEYVEYCLRSGDLIAQGNETYWVPPSDDESSADWAAKGALHYSRNELASLIGLFRSYALRDSEREEQLWSGGTANAGGCGPESPGSALWFSRGGSSWPSPAT